MEVDRCCWLTVKIAVSTYETHDELITFCDAVIFGLIFSFTLFATLFDKL